MEYTYSAYKGLMGKLRKMGYTPIRFCDVSEKIKAPAIIRHDVDLDLQKAEEMAQVEHELDIRSTYFVLLTSEYYNLLSGRNMESVKNILALGHEIGLHFDITAYEAGLPLVKIGGVLKKELSLLENVLGMKVRSISWHIPREDLLGVHLDFTDDLGVFNAYDPYFFRGYKYVSDSMMRWREPVEEYIDKKMFEKLQILTHPSWYRDVQDMSDVEILKKNYEKKTVIQKRYLNTLRPGMYPEEMTADRT